MLAMRIVPTSTVSFRNELARRYKQLTNQTLRRTFLKRCIDTWTEIYTFEAAHAGEDIAAPDLKKVRQADVFDLCLSMAVRSLVVLTERLPTTCLEPQDTNSVFSISVDLQQEVLRYDEPHNALLWQPGMRAVYEAALEPVHALMPRASALGMFRHLPTKPNFGLLTPTPQDFYEPVRGEQTLNRAKYERAQRQYERQEEQLEKRLEEYRHPFVGTPLFTLANNFIPDGVVTIPVSIPQELWYSSAWICAPQGKGKTNLLKALVAEFGGKGTIMLMDAKGELIKPFLAHAHVIEPLNPPQLNPLALGDIHSVELVEYIFSALLEAQLTPKQSTLLSFVLTLASIIPDATIQTVEHLLTHGTADFSRYVAVLPERERTFFTHGQFQKDFTDTKREILWRIQLLLRNKYLAQMLASPSMSIDMQRLMDSGGLVVIDNNPDILGEMGAEFFGRLMIALVWREVKARARRGGNKTPVFFIIDEAQTVIYRDTTIPKLIHQCRSQNVALIFAHQELQQMKSPDVAAALGNCAIRFAAPDEERSTLAPRFRCAPEFFDNLPKYHFAACIRNQPTMALKVPPVTIKHRERVAPAQEPEIEIIPPKPEYDDF